MTNLYASGDLDLDLEDVARFVGYSDRGYVQSDGERPQMVWRKAFGILDLRGTPPDALGSTNSPSGS